MNPVAYRATKNIRVGWHQAKKTTWQRIEDTLPKTYKDLELIRRRERKEGQLRSLRWVCQVMLNQIERETKELQKIKEEIGH